MSGTVSVLIDETRQRFGVNITDLSDGAHTAVVVRCNQCWEVFTREFRCLHHKHDCATHTGSMKWCSTCRAYLPTTDFATTPTNYDGLSAICVPCRTNLVRHYSHSEWPDSVTKKLLFDTIDEQHGLCYFSRLPLNLGAHFGAIGVRARYVELPIGPGNLALYNNWRDPKEEPPTPPNRIRLEAKPLADGAQTPSRKRATDAGYDVHSIEQKVVPAGGYAIIETGIAVSPPDGYYFTVEGRSSLGLLGIIPFRGIIDGTYQGELKITLMNRSNNDYVVQPCDRIAQIILHQILHADFSVVSQFGPVVNGRNIDGFGSSGK